MGVPSEVGPSKGSNVVVETGFRQAPVLAR